jgi:hypothetical protein
VIPENGVQLVRSLEEAKKIPLDLVMCCGVLEHLNDPEELVKTILAFNAEVFLFEVPTGTPSHRKGLAKYRFLLKLFASNRVLWRIVQKIERNSDRKWRAYFPLRCSEHLQFFSTDGLSQLLEYCGLEILIISETKPNTALADEQNLGFEAGLIAVCRKKST